MTRQRRGRRGGGREGAGGGERGRRKTKRNKRKKDKKTLILCPKLENRASVEFLYVKKLTSLKSLYFT